MGERQDSISRQAAIDALNDEFTIIGKTNAIVVQDYIRRINNRLHDLPSAQPQQKTGKWIPENDIGRYETRFMCSACGEYERVPTIMGEPIFRFCPWCGAKMEGAEENERH